jgi:hypothetical protein
MSDRIEEKLYCELFLDCERPGCTELFDFVEAASDPMEAWSKRAAMEAKKLGWRVDLEGVIVCSKCALHV